MSDEAIPEDVMKLANAALLRLQNHVSTYEGWNTSASEKVIARAILAERERCAKIAETRKTPVMKYGSRDAKLYHLAGISYASEAIASSIRSSS